jgi:hypothetical protein
MRRLRLDLLLAAVLAVSAVTLAAPGAASAAKTLLGSEATIYASEVANATGRITAFQFVAKETGTIKELKIRSGATANTATSLVLGVAAEHAGVPAEAPLGHATATGTPGTETLITVTGLSVAVTAGTPYWLEVLNLGGTFHYKYANEANSTNGGGLSWIESKAAGLSSLTNSEWETFEAGFSSPLGPMCFYARGTGTAGKQKPRFGIDGNQDNGHSAEWIKSKIFGGSHGSLETEYDASSPVEVSEAVGDALELGISPPIVTIDTHNATRLSLVTPATYAEKAVAMIKQIVSEHPTATTYELINEPWYKGAQGSNASDYAAIVQATYEKVAAEGLTGLTLLVGAHGDYEEVNAEGSTEEGKRPWSQTYGGRGWTADVLTSHPELKTLVNGWYSHPYGRPKENWQQSGGMYAVQSDRLMVIRHGGSGYNNWWVTEVGFNLGHEGPAGVATEAEQSEKLKEDLETSVEWSKEGWFTGILPYADGGSEGYNIWKTPAGKMYMSFAALHG